MTRFLHMVTHNNPAFKPMPTLQQITRWTSDVELASSRHPNPTSAFTQQHQSSSSTRRHPPNSIHPTVSTQQHPLNGIHSTAPVFIQQQPCLPSSTLSSGHSTHPTVILRGRSFSSTHKTKAQYLAGHDDKIQITAPTQQRASDVATL